MSQPLNIIIVEKGGSLKSTSIKDYKEEDLFKKCGFKKPDEFGKQVEWSVKYEGKKYFIHVFAKVNGKANSENKYDFPPPIDTKLFFGNCAIVAKVRNGDGTVVLTDLTLQMWNKIYEKLFGGFEDLAATAEEDENEEDELANVPKEKKTKQGYLKDGFVVDSSETEESDNDGSRSEDEDEDDEEDTETLSDDEEDKCDAELSDLGSELSEDSYEYDSN